MTFRSLFTVWVVCFLALAMVAGLWFAIAIMAISLALGIANAVWG